MLQIIYTDTAHESNLNQEIAPHFLKKLKADIRDMLAHSEIAPLSLSKSNSETENHLVFTAIFDALPISEDMQQKVNDSISIIPPIKVIESENYHLAIEDANEIRHYFDEDGSYDGWAAPVAEADSISDDN